MLHKETVVVLTSIKKRNQLWKQDAVYLKTKLSVHKETSGLSHIGTLIIGEHLFAAFKFFTNSNFLFLLKCHFEIEFSYLKIKILYNLFCWSKRKQNLKTRVL